MAFKFSGFVVVTLLILRSFLKASGDSSSTIGDGKCIWYGTCAKNPDNPSHQLNCKYDGKAKLLNDTKAIDMLGSLCPDLVKEIKGIEEYQGEIRTCCSKKQIKILRRELRLMLPLLVNCPACVTNLKKNFCYFTCHPRQSAFLVPTQYLKNENAGEGHIDQSEASIFTVMQYQTETYINATYDSCKSVYCAQTNGPAMDLLCGPWGARQCTPQRLFDYFGSNFMAPFETTYNYTEANTTADVIDVENNFVRKKFVTPFNVETFPCNTETPKYACRCLDCEEACPRLPNETDTREPITIGQLQLSTFVIILVYIAFLLLTLIVFVCCGFPGRQEESEGCCTFNHKLSAVSEKFLETGFTKFAKAIVSCPVIVLVIGAIGIIILSAGALKLELTTDPVDLWAAPSSRARRDKDRFDSYFGPFYRTNQIIVSSIGIEPLMNVPIGKSYYDFGPVFNATFFLALMDMQLEIMDLVAEYDGQNVTLNDVCIKPMEPQHPECLIESVFNYWQNDWKNLCSMMYEDCDCDPGSECDGEPSPEYLEHLVACVNNPTLIDMSKNETCMGTYGGPVFPYIALGGFLQEGETLADNPTYENSTALVLTFLLQNYLNTTNLGPALAWEKVYLDFLKNYTNEMMSIAFYSERSLQDEIERESKGDVSTILISYFVMFVYVALALGQFNSQCNRFCVETKITLGLCSVALVFLSVSSSVGLCAYIGIKGTLFVIEVIPFLALAVGVDNIFLLVQTWQRIQRKNDESVEDHVARCVGKTAPSMILATTSETICFFLGALSDMPAVHTFSLYAGFALVIDFLLQITCLVALIVLDAKRQNADRFDVMCCFEGPNKSHSKKSKGSSCVSFFESFYAPFILSDFMRMVILFVFVGGFCASCAIIPRLDVGLEQDIGMPEDSYVINYFEAMAEYLAVGSPVYFVMENGLNLSDPTEQDLICQSKGCDANSMLSRIFFASQVPEDSRIAAGANSWLDGYFLWISDVPNDVKSACCRLDKENNFIDSSDEIAKEAVRTCLEKDELIEEEYGQPRPLPDKFYEYLPDFLIDNPHGMKCPQAGHPVYATSVTLTTENNLTEVRASNFMSYHTLLKVSKEFTDGVKKAYMLTDNFTEYLFENTGKKVDIFPYSIFYVFYEQYLTMWSAAGLSLGVSFISLFLVMLLLTGLDFRTSLINMIIIVMVTIDIMGVMVPWEIQFNAISLVNLVMASGITMEFCSHISHAFSMTPKGTKIERAIKALSYTGTSVLSGIILTKFGGIIVLAFSNSQVFIIYYFRMYLLIVLLGAAHGLILLPVLLSLIGPSPNKYLVPEEERKLK